MKALVGYTGFVGGNLAASADFDGLYNSKNIEEAFGTKPDILYYAGVPAEKYIANKFPEEDEKIVRNAMDNIRKIDPKLLVLISTVDVYRDPFRATEETMAAGQGTYGKNRRLLECYVEDYFPDSLIVRLPGLFGKGIKKNFIFDYIRYIPALLNEQKYAELSARREELKDYYVLNDKGFYACQAEKPEERRLLKAIFEDLGFSALHFTDSRAIYQFYDLSDLYGDIERAIDAGLSLLNMATEPVSAGEVYRYLTGETFVNEITEDPVHYDMRTIHYEMLGGIQAENEKSGYLYRKDDILQRIKTFTEKEITL